MKGLNDYNASLFPPLKTHGSSGEAIYDFQLCKATNTHTFYKYLTPTDTLEELSLLCPHSQAKYFSKKKAFTIQILVRTYIQSERCP